MIKKTQIFLLWFCNKSIKYANLVASVKNNDN